MTNESHKLITLNKLYAYDKLDRVTHKNGKRYYVSPTGDKLSSVTTILGATKNDDGLKKWRAWVGDKKADQIVNEACNLGSLMHEHLENYVAGEPRPGGTNLIRKMAADMADVVIDQGLSNIDEIWGIEEILYYPKLYAGTTDLVGVHNGSAAIMDHKTSNKMKTKAQVQDYYCQGVAYANAHNHLFGTDIKKVVLFMVDRQKVFKEWILEGDEFDAVNVKWQARLDTFYSDKV